MKLHLWAAAVTGGFISAAAMFIAAVLFKLTSGSGEIFLRLCDGLFPLYHPHQGAANLIVGLVNALIEGAILALIASWLYNLCVDLLSKKGEARPQA